MQYQALRKVASSKLMLFAAISLLLLIAALPVLMWFIMDNVMLSNPVQQLPFFDMTAMVRVILFVVLIPVIALESLPVIALLMIRANARSPHFLKRTGFTMLRGFEITMIVLGGISLIYYFCILIAHADSGLVLPYVSNFLTVLFWLLISILSLNALQAAREVVTCGGTARKVGNALPILMIASACLTAASLILTVLANTVPSMIVPLQAYRVETAALFYAQVTYSGLSLVSSALLILLCFRGIKALSQPPELPTSY